MALRFDTSTDYIYRDSNLPGITSFTMMAWVYISVDRNDFSPILQYGDANPGTPTEYIVYTMGDGVTLASWNSSSEITGSVLSVGTWYHLAITVAGTGANQFLTYLNGAVNITNNGSASVTNERISFATNTGASGNEWLNGRIAACKIYAAVLTAAEIQQEMMFYTPQRTANLNTWLPCVDPTVANNLLDASGNGYNMTGAAGTRTVEDGPPIAWRRGSGKRIYTLSTIPPPSTRIRDMIGLDIFPKKR